MFHGPAYALTHTTDGRPLHSILLSPPESATKHVKKLSRQGHFGCNTTNGHERLFFLLGLLLYFSFSVVTQNKGMKAGCVLLCWLSPPPCVLGASCRRGLFGALIACSRSCVVGPRSWAGSPCWSVPFWVSCCCLRCYTCSPIASLCNT